MSKADGIQNQGWAPSFHPGGSSEAPKVWNKKNKRARGMLTNNREPKNIGVAGQFNKPNNKSVTLTPLNPKAMGRVGSPHQSNLVDSHRNITETETQSFAMSGFDKQSAKSFDSHLKLPEPDGIKQQPDGVSAIAEKEDEMVVETQTARQGFANRKNKNHVGDLVRRYKPDILILFETHTMFTTAESYWARENYVKIDVQEVQGHSGGIWAMHRRGSDFNFTLVSKIHQCVSFIVSKGAEKWLCSGVYASPIYTVRPLLWNYLVDLSRSNALPWVAIGDFNDILLPSEQKGGVFSLSKADTFAGNIDNCGFIDLGCFGTKFTWQGRCRGGRIVHRRLDRSFCNYDWRLKFPEATVEHLVRKHSDHNPILLRCNNAMARHENRPFRFQAAWFTHSEYPDLVRNTWARNRNNIVCSLQNVARESTIFNKDVFGNIFARKKELEARLR
ncbi:RNA-directed DNA polymerase (Reverse transcriptase), partial [Trifolium medium]|nr:RNA-directed DNA polymerase (Reverse transcriptase) [Trifolium medium]